MMCSTTQNFKTYNHGRKGNFTPKFMGFMPIGQTAKERSNANEYILSMHRFRWTFHHLRNCGQHRLKRNKSNANNTFRHLRISHNIYRINWL